MSMRLGELAERIGAEVRGDDSIVVESCAGLVEADGTQVSFLANPLYAPHLATTRAAAVIVRPADAHRGQQLNLLVADDPYFAFREAVIALHGFRQQPPPGISEQALVHPGAKIGQDCAILPFVYIDEDAVIGDGTVIHPYSYVGARSRIGKQAILYPHVTVYDDSRIGDRVILQAGCTIGVDGFGHSTHDGAHHKIPQAGIAIVEDDVELGAGCIVNRATVGETVVGRGTRSGELIIYGHGSRVGRHVLMSGQTGIGGSAQLGDWVMIGGQSGIRNHVRLGDRAQVAAKSVVLQDVEEGGRVMGIPAMEWNRSRRARAHFARLPELVRRVAALERRLAELESEEG